MNLNVDKISVTILFIVFCVNQCGIAECYKTEIEMTPSPIEESTTKKSGFFGGIKSFFRGSPTTTAVPSLVEVTTSKSFSSKIPKTAADSQPHSYVTGAQKPPPLVIQHAPLMPLGPRPDTPLSSPLIGNQQHPPQWPQAHNNPTTSTMRPVQQPLPQNPQFVGIPFGANSAQHPNPGEPNISPGFTPYRSSTPQPSGLDLSYGGGPVASRPQSGVRPSFGLAPLTSTTSTTTLKPVLSGMAFDLRGQFGDISSTTTQRPSDTFPVLPTSRRPSVSTKEDFPALPVPKSPSPTPPTLSKPYSPSAWNTPLSTVATPMHPVVNLPTTTVSAVRAGSSVISSTPSTSSADGNHVAFIPHAPYADKTTTVRPGFQNSGNSVATDDEIRALTETLFTKEVNSQLNQIRINIQGKTRSIDSTDEAPQPLLEIDDKAFEPLTIAKMRLLFNNYETDTMVNEHVTPNERKEENNFLDEVMATPLMRLAMQFLQNKGIVSLDPKTHRDLVKELWFTQYSRGNGKIGSSGFEHVFVNEVKNGTIIGLHNWVYFYDEEKAGRLDYKGYINKLDLGLKGKILKTRFTHNGLNKPVNTLFVGTSPELELALYTVCFQLRPDRTCPVSLGNNKFGIVTYSWRYRGKSLIGSAYPEI